MPPKHPQQRAGDRSIVMVTLDRHIDRRILLEADVLERVGWSVRILAAPPDETTGKDDPRVERIGAGPGQEGYPKREGVVLAMYRITRQLVPMDGRVMKALKRFAWRHVVRQDQFFLRLFESSILARPASVYVAHDLPMLPAALVAKRRHGCKVVYDSHELYAEQEFSAHERRVWREIESRAIHEADAVITINPSVARELERRYRVSGVHVVYNAEQVGAEGPQPDRRFHREFGLPATARVLLMQGGLSAGRNIETLVRAMRQVKVPDVHLVVMGDGQLKTHLRRIVADGLQGRVHLKDAVPQADLVSWSAAADAGVIPYQATCLNNYYCTPNKLFEFIAAGLPVLGSDLPEIRAIVVGHGIGDVADLSSEERIAAAIDGFFADPARLATWRVGAAAARRSVNWDVEGAKVVRIFDALR